jgi:hypothetical protein
VREYAEHVAQTSGSSLCSRAHYTHGEVLIGKSRNPLFPGEYGAEEERTIVTGNPSENTFGEHGNFHYESVTPASIFVIR